MDKGTTGVTPGSSNDAEHAAVIEKEIEGIRGKLDGLVAELDHRRHRLSPIRAVRKHPSIFAFAGLILLAGVVGTTYRARRRKRHSWLERGKRLKHAADRVMAGKSIEQPPNNIWLRAIVAAASATGALVGKRLVRRFLSRS